MCVSLVITSCLDPKILVGSSNLCFLSWAEVWHAINALGRMEVQLHSFLNLALDRGEWSVSCPSFFTHRKTALSTHSVGDNGLQIESGDCVDEKILCSFQEPNRDSPTDLPTGLLLYQLSYHFLALRLKISLLFHIFIGIYVLQLLFISLM